MWIESFNLVADTNGDGVLSRAEAWQVAGWLYQLPGNLVIELLGAIHPVAHLLHIQASAGTGYSSLNGGLATVASTLIWLLILVHLAGLRDKWIQHAQQRHQHGVHRSRRAQHFRHPAGKA